MNQLFFILTFLAVLGSGLMAGVFFAFSSFVMRALAKLAPSEAIAAMQSINVAVLNPLFLTVFMGTAAACAVLVLGALFRWGESGGTYLLAGSLLYLTGTFLVTIAGNVPLNESLASVNASSSEGAALWIQYLDRWTKWNHLRSAAALGALVCFILSLYRPAR